MKVLITGASSTLGQNLITALLNTGKITIRLLEHHSPVQREHCETVKGSLQDVASLTQACFEIDTVIHLAALTHSPSRRAYFEVNETGTENLIKVCQENKVRRFIYVSSAAASEEGGEYGISKLRGEEKVQQSVLDWAILRPSEVYGVDMEEGIGKLMLWVKRYPIIPVIEDGLYFLSPVYVDDIVQAMVEIFKKDSLGKITLNLCGPEEITMNELIDRIALNLNVQRKKLFLPVWLVRMGMGLLSFFKSDLAFSDQIPRLLCEKDRCIKGTQAVISYNPIKIEEGLISIQNKTN